MAHDGPRCKPIACTECGGSYCACKHWHYPNWPIGLCPKCEVMIDRLKRLRIRVQSGDLTP